MSSIGMFDGFGGRRPEVAACFLVWIKPLTKRAQELDFVSFGLAILSHKGERQNPRYHLATSEGRARGTLPLPL